MATAARATLRSPPAGAQRGQGWDSEPGERNFELYSVLRLTVMANELITPFLIEQVRARIAERSVRNVTELRTLAEGQPCEGKEIRDERHCANDRKPNTATIALTLHIGSGSI